MKYFLLFFSFIFGFFIPDQVCAANYLYNTHYLEENNTNKVQINLSLNPNDITINTFEGKLKYDKNILKLESISYEESYIFWVNKPKNKENNVLIFSGAIPGGVNEKIDNIITLNFLQTKLESTNLNLFDGFVYLDDRKGTQISVEEKNININGDQKVKRVDIIEDKDIIPPKIHSVFEYNDSFGNEFVSFLVKDSGSGVSKVEVYETVFPWMILGKWTEQESPYKRKKGKIFLNLFIKTTDYEGNQSIVHIPANKYSKTIFFIVIIITFLSVIVLVMKKLKK